MSNVWVGLLKKNKKNLNIITATFLASSFVNLDSRINLH